MGNCTTARGDAAAAAAVAAVAVPAAAAAPPAFGIGDKVEAGDDKRCLGEDICAGACAATGELAAEGTATTETEGEVDSIMGLIGGNTEVCCCCICVTAATAVFVLVGVVVSGKGALGSDGTFAALVAGLGVDTTANNPFCCRGCCWVVVVVVVSFMPSINPDTGSMSGGSSASTAATVVVVAGCAEVVVAAVVGVVDGLETGVVEGLDSAEGGTSVAVAGAILVAGAAGEMTFCAAAASSCLACSRIALIFSSVWASSDSDSLPLLLPVLLRCRGLALGLSLFFLIDAGAKGSSVVDSSGADTTKCRGFCCCNSASFASSSAALIRSFFPLILVGGEDTVACSELASVVRTEGSEVVALGTWAGIGAGAGSSGFLTGLGFFSSLVGVAATVVLETAALDPGEIERLAVLLSSSMSGQSNTEVAAGLLAAAASAAVSDFRLR